LFSRNKATKQIFQKQIHKTNPGNESFKKGLRNKTTKRIFWNQYGFANPKPRICKDLGLYKVRLCTKDSSGFVGFVKTGRIFWKSVYEMNLLKTLRIRDPWYKTNPDSFRKARIESFWSQDLWLRYKMNPHFYESLIWFPHPYKIN
jgi:hypothetical protein